MGPTEVCGQTSRSQLGMEEAGFRGTARPSKDGVNTSFSQMQDPCAEGLSLARSLAGSL